MQSVGDGERSRFVVTWLSPSERPAQWPRLSERLVRLVEWPRCPLGRPSTGMPFSDRNSSRSAYWKNRGEEVSQVIRNRWVDVRCGWIWNFWWQLIFFSSFTHVTSQLPIKWLCRVTDKLLLPKSSTQSKGNMFLPNDPKTLLGCRNFKLLNRRSLARNTVFSLK